MEKLGPKASERAAYFTTHLSIYVEPYFIALSYSTYDPTAIMIHKLTIQGSYVSGSDRRAISQA